MKKKKKLRVPACWMTAFSDRNASRAINEWQYECGCCRPILSPSCNLQHSSSNGNKWRNLRLERCPTQETLKLSTENSQIFRFKISFQKWKKKPFHCWIKFENVYRDGTIKCNSFDSFLIKYPAYLPVVKQPASVVGHSLQLRQFLFEPHHCILFAALIL